MADTLTNDFAADLAAEFVDKPTLCAGIGISTRTLDRLEVARIGPPKTKIGKRVLYRKAAVREWLASREQGNATRAARARR